MLVSLIDHINQNDTIGSIDQDPNIDQETASCTKPNQPSTPENLKLSLQFKETLRSIYNIYFSPRFDPPQLDKCLADIGVDQKDIKIAVDGLMASKSKADKQHIYFQEFERVMEGLMSRDH